MNRRAFLGGTSAGAVLWALGCHGKNDQATIAHSTESQVRTWLRDAVGRLAAVYPSVHALASQRRRITAAFDVLGEGVSHGRADAVVLVVRGSDGVRREHVTSDLSKAGVEAAATALAGKAPRKSKSIDFGAPAIANADLEEVSDAALVDRVHHLVADDPELSSRIVYTAGVFDIDDSHVWSIGTSGRDQEQRLVRVRQAVTRVAWSGTRPVVTEAARGWLGDLHDDALTAGAVSRATVDALAIMTQGTITDGTQAVALDTSVVAKIVDTATRALLTSTAQKRPEVARRLAVGATVAAPLLTLVDDPTAGHAYGGFHFDDDGTPAAPVTLLDAGRVSGHLAGGCRPGHAGRSEPAPSHLRLAAGTAKLDDLVGDGYRLEGGLDAVIDPSSDRFSIAIARAAEIKSGRATGRVFADVELVGALGSLLAGVTALGEDRDLFPIREDVDGRPRWRSLEVPALATTGLVRARRRSA